MKLCAPTARAASSISRPAGAGRPKRDVVRDGAGEHEVLLGHHHHRAPQIGVGQVAQVDPVEPHRAAGRVVEPGQQLGDGRLAGAGGADQRDGLPSAIAQVQVVQITGRSGT